MSFTESATIEPVGIIHTPFRQKFAIPRQPNLAGAKGQIVMQTDYANPQAFKGIEAFSHVWLLFYFHETAARGWKPAVKAPRLGGNATLGVFASRSTHRPNSIGMSVVKNDGLSVESDRVVLNVSGVDLLDGTPVIDIKPYIPYADAVNEADDTLTSSSPIPRRNVIFTAEADRQCHALSARWSDIIPLTQDILSQDPRPAYRHKLDDDDKVYKVSLYDVDISWQIINSDVVVLSLTPLPAGQRQT